jgi:hypothetical protein
MTSVRAALERTTRRRIFPHWSLEVPASFDETFVREDGYWHAWDTDRSISFSSMVISDHDRPAPVTALLEQLTPIEGTPVADLPTGLVGWAVTDDAIPPARAGRMLRGMLATDGRIAIVTVTSDDLAWALRVWLSIRTHADGARPATYGAHRSGRRRHRDHR